jgi:hypothetical protein
MAFSRHTVADQSPSERLCLCPDSRSLTRAEVSFGGRHLDVLSPTHRSVRSWANSRDTGFEEISAQEPLRNAHALQEDFNEATIAADAFACRRRPVWRELI